MQGDRAAAVAASVVQRVLLRVEAQRAQGAAEELAIDPLLEVSLGRWATVRVAEVDGVAVGVAEADGHGGVSEVVLLVSLVLCRNPEADCVC